MALIICRPPHPTLKHRQPIPAANRRITPIDLPGRIWPRCRPRRGGLRGRAYWLGCNVRRSAAGAGDIDVWLPTSPDPGTAYPLTEKRRKVIDASVDRSQTLRLNESGATLQASSGSRRAWRTKDGPWQVFGNATVALASLARWLANQDHRGRQLLRRVSVALVRVPAHVRERSRRSTAPWTSVPNPCHPAASPSQPHGLECHGSTALPGGWYRATVHGGRAKEESVIGYEGAAPRSRTGAYLEVHP